MLARILLVSTLMLFGMSACATQNAQPDDGPFTSFDANASAPAIFAPGTVSDPRTPQWMIAVTPDARRLFVSTDAPRRIVMHDWSAGGWSVPSPLPNAPNFDHGAPVLSPDGKTLYFSGEGAGGRRDLYRLDLTDPSAQPEQLTQTPGYGEIRIALDETGKGFLWTDRRADGADGMGFYAVTLEGDDLRLTADASDLHQGDPSGENSPYIDPKGRFLIFSNYGLGDGGDEDLYLSELRDGEPLPPIPLGEVVNTEMGEGSAIISPDEDFLLFVSGNPSVEGDSQIWIVPTASVPALNAVLTAGEPAEAYSFTPDIGTTISSDALRDCEAGQCLIETDAPYSGRVEDYYPSGQIKSRRVLLDGKVEGVWTEWHENGRISFYSEWRNGLGHGTWLYFHENGELSQRAFAQNDIWMGVTEGWSETGEKNYQALHRQGVNTSLWDGRKGNQPAAQ